MTEENENDDISLLSLESLLEEERRSYAPFDPFKRDAIKLKMRELSKDELIDLKNTTSPDNDMYFVIEHELLLKSKIEFCEQKYKKDHKLLMKLSRIQGLLFLVFMVIGCFVMSKTQFPVLSTGDLATICLFMLTFVLSVYCLKYFIHKKFRKEIDEIDLKHRDDLFEINKKFMNKSTSETFNSVINSSNSKRA